MKTRGGWALTVLALGFLALAAAPAIAQDECVACHEDVVKGFAKSSHGRTFAAAKDYQGSSCTSCHTGAKEHAEAGGDKKPLSLSLGAAPQANASCLSCHAGHGKTALWEGSAHQLAGLKCASCHDVHNLHIGTPEQAKTLPGASPTTKKCLECHGDLRPALQARSTHPMRDGQMDCASCHNPADPAHRPSHRRGGGPAREPRRGGLPRGDRQHARGGGPPHAADRRASHPGPRRRGRGEAAPGDGGPRRSRPGGRGPPLGASRGEGAEARGRRGSPERAGGSHRPPPSARQPRGERHQVCPGHTRIRLATGRRGGTAVLEVAGEGPGIAPEHRERVFERFYRVDKSRSREMGGTGLGLALVECAAQAHGGRVEPETEVGRGSTFRIVLPSEPSSTDH